MTPETRWTRSAALLEHMRRREANNDLGQGAAITAMVNAGVPTGTAQRMFNDRVDMRVGTLKKWAAKVGMDWQLLVQRSVTAASKAAPTPSPSPAAPSLAEALPVVLDALADAPDRGRLRTALLALLDDDAPPYRQRLAELLAPPVTAAPTPAPRKQQAA